jgi:hypothetical protein
MDAYEVESKEKATLRIPSPRQAIKPISVSCPLTYQSHLLCDTDISLNLYLRLMTTDYSDLHKTISISGRNFRLRLIHFSNGCFMLVSEGAEERLGSLTLSLKIRDRIEHTSVIPEMRAMIFAPILADLVAKFSSGISVVSLYLEDALQQELAQDLLKLIRDFLTTSKTSE